MKDRDKFDLFGQKIKASLEAQGIPPTLASFTFSEDAARAAQNGQWHGALVEVKAFIEKVCSNGLADEHKFVVDPWIRRVNVTNEMALNIAIINSQAADWYGSEDAVGAFDFLIEEQKGLFARCNSYLDLGAHQFIWSCYYAMRSSNTSVCAFEPSTVNVIIGLFNSLINNVIEQVTVFPFAVAASDEEGSTEAGKMLVDFVKEPVRTCRLDVCAEYSFDFVKVDIEGYEFELLGDPDFLSRIAGAKHVHLEVHLGHLIKRNVGREAVVNRMDAAGIDGEELYSGVEMYKFLESCDPSGFYAFLIDCKRMHSRSAM